MPAGPASLDDLRIDRSRESSGPRRWLWGLVLLVVLGAAGAGGWLWWTRAQIPVVTVGPVRQTTAADARPAVLNASGYVTARRRATVSSKVTGKVLEVMVEEGMAVRQGQILARLDDSSERSYLSLAEAQLAAARSAVEELEVRRNEALLTLTRSQGLVARGVLSQAELDTAQAEFDWLGARISLSNEQIEVAERELDVRRTALEDMVVRAPFSGVAISKDAQPGEMVSPVSAGGGFTRTGISTIVDMTSLEIEVDVNESYINRVTPGQRVVASLDAYPDWPIPASVITIIPAADRQRATVLVRIAFDELDPRILPDMGINVAFLEADAPVDAAKQTRLWVPSSAVHLEGDVMVVFVLQGNTVERRAVTLGLEDGEAVEVMGGVRAAERLVIEASVDLVDGQVVAVAPG